MNNSISDDTFEPHTDQQNSHYLAHSIQPQSQPQTRRPRGFAATAAASAARIGANDGAAGSTAGAKGKREKEKKRTKLREPHRRAITSRMRAGLRQYGNFPLPARADMNDVLAALAREAGWIVEADGTTYRQSPPPPLPQSQLAAFRVRSVESPLFWFFEELFHESNTRLSGICSQN